MLNRNIQRIATILTKSVYFPFTSQKQSYYDMLGVSPSSTEKQIRQQFLKRAQKLHPDHNKDEEAQEEFKKIKQAYETLKDPQKRYIYDSGISIDPNAEGQQYSDFTVNANRKYYQNKWYSFKKNNYSDQRDDYYEQREEWLKDKNKMDSKTGGIIFVGLFFLAYIYFLERQSFKDTERKHIEEILESKDSNESIQGKKLKRYMSQRSSHHKVE